MDLKMSLVIWIGVCVVAVIFEAITVQLVSIWFAIGAIGAAVSAMFTNNFYIQLAVFIALSGILLIATLPIVKKLRNKPVRKLNLDSAVGKTAIIKSELGIDSQTSLGEMKLLGKTWTVQNGTTEIIKAGTTVEVTEIKGCRLVVKPYIENSKEN